MKKILVKTKPSYPIFISAFDIGNAISNIKSLLKEDRLFIITNTTIKKLYCAKLDAAFKKSFKTIYLTIPDGEKYKNLTTIENLLTKLSENGAQRRSLILALGGGVVGDIAGFVAATYMRGIHFVQMPTTLLAQVDSSVGGKTGVDLKTGKNLAGAFYQPRAVSIFTDFLKTLSDRELQCGLAEMIKYGLIWDDKLFFDIHKLLPLIFKRDAKILTSLIARCVTIKAKVVGQDERETGLRAVLNFGHTLGHAVESLGHYKRHLHGEAVAIGMQFAANLSAHLKLCSTKVPQILNHVLVQAGLPTVVPSYTPAAYLRAISGDKKAVGKNIRFVLVKNIGKVVLTELDLNFLIKNLKLSS